jgi:hypothetical protein
VISSSQVAPIRAVLAINKSDPKDVLYPEVSGWVENYKAPFVMYFFVSVLTVDDVKLRFREVARIADSSRIETDSGQPQPEGLGEGQGDSS